MLFNSILAHFRKEEHPAPLKLLVATVCILFIHALRWEISYESMLYLNSMTMF